MTASPPTPGRFVERYGRYFGVRRVEAIRKLNYLLIEARGEGPYVHHTEGRRLLDLWNAGGMRTAIEETLRLLPRANAMGDRLAAAVDDLRRAEALPVAHSRGRADRRVCREGGADAGKLRLRRRTLARRKRPQKHVRHALEEAQKTKGEPG